MISSEDEDRLDGALARLAAYGTDLVNGMTSHAPMVAEALCVLGRMDAADAWIERHLREFTPWPAAAGRIEPDQWRAALARRDRAADWRALFDTELSHEDWRVVLDRWCARLVPGATTAATHGLIRVGHAARSMARRDTAPRRAELAAGLALWASNYQALPGPDRRSSPGFAPRAALARVAFLPVEQRRNDGSITTALAQLAGHPPFVEVVDLLAAKDPIEESVRDMVDLFAGVFLANARTPLEAIVFTHGVTVFGAVGNIAPAVSHQTAHDLMRRAWQAAAALYAAYGTAAPGHEPQSRPASADELVARAVDHGDDHVIKLTEACLAWTPADRAAPRQAAMRIGELIPPTPMV